MHERQSVSSVLGLRSRIMGLGCHLQTKEVYSSSSMKHENYIPAFSIVAISTLQSYAREICECTLQNTVTEAVLGHLERKVSVSAKGVSVVRLNGGLVTQCADSPDGLSARRTALGAYFIEWIES